MSAVGTTWARTHTFAAPALVEARTIDDVVAAVRRGGAVRALGTRHSFHDLADTTGTLVSVTGIDADPVIDEAAHTVTVGGGTRYGVLAGWLEQRGWALHNLGSLPHISIAGATATGTHGSGDRNGNLSTAVRALEYVDAGGEVQVARAGDPGFDGLVVGLGAYGIVVRVTLAIEASYAMRQDVYVGVTWTDLLDDLEAVTGSSYSVSVFTTWVGDDVGPVWRKSRLDGDQPRELPDEWLGATRQRALTELVGNTDNLTTQGGVPGPWSERLPHFRLDSTPSNGDEIQSEFFVDRADAPDALRAVRELGRDIEPLLLVTELRTMRSDPLWLSGAYGRDTLGIHFTWRNLPREVSAILPRIEAVLAPFGARPHWGKWHTFDASGIAAVHPRLDDARALFERLDPDGRFANDHLRRLGVRTVR